MQNRANLHNASINNVANPTGQFYVSPIQNMEITAIHEGKSTRSATNSMITTLVTPLASLPPWKLIFKSSIYLIPNSNLEMCCCYCCSATDINTNSFLPILTPQATDKLTTAVAIFVFSSRHYPHVLPLSQSVNTQLALAPASPDSGPIVPSERRTP
ncbi:hypothetical protein ACFX1Q_035257 [Malus domestica]